MAVPELTSDDITALLAAHPAWALAREGKAITRTFQFKDFSEAWGFMSRVALLAEALQCAQVEGCGDLARPG